MRARGEAAMSVERDIFSCPCWLAQEMASTHKRRAVACAGGWPTASGKTLDVAVVIGKNRGVGSMPEYGLWTGNRGL